MCMHGGKVCRRARLDEEDRTDAHRVVRLVAAAHTPAVLAARRPLEAHRSLPKEDRVRLHAATAVKARQLRSEDPSPPPPPDGRLHLLHRPHGQAVRLLLVGGPLQALLLRVGVPTAVSVATAVIAAMQRTSDPRCCVHDGRGRGRGLLRQPAAGSMS